MRRNQRVSGGMAEGMPLDVFDPEQLGMGIEVEMEHTDDRRVAEEIARDHLAEQIKAGLPQDYYTRLQRMEGDMRANATDDAVADALEMAQEGADEARIARMLNRRHGLSGDRGRFLAERAHAIVASRARMGMTMQANRKWTKKYINELPDSAFLWVAPGGTKRQGRTHPLHLRSLPYKNKSGKVDLPHLRNSLARLRLTEDIPEREKPAIRKQACRVLVKHGGQCGTSEYSANQDLMADEEYASAYTEARESGATPAEADAYAHAMAWDDYHQRRMLTAGFSDLPDVSAAPPSRHRGNQSLSVECSTEGDTMLQVDFTEEELNGLGYIADRYDSGRILYNEYDSENGEISQRAVWAAYAATPGDGGDLGTVPLAGGTLAEKIAALFVVSNAHAAYLEMDSAEYDENARTPHRTNRKNPRGSFRPGDVVVVDGQRAAVVTSSGGTCVVKFGDASTRVLACSQLSYAPPLYLENAGARGPSLAMPQHIGLGLCEFADEQRTPESYGLLAQAMNYDPVGLGGLRRAIIELEERNLALNNSKLDQLITEMKTFADNPPQEYILAATEEE